MWVAWYHVSHVISTVCLVLDHVATLQLSYFCVTSRQTLDVPLLRVQSLLC
jgi:hypothetical protein